MTTLDSITASIAAYGSEQYAAGYAARVAEEHPVLLADDFTDKRIDTSLWTVLDGYARAGHGEIATAANVTQTGGVLRITMNKRTLTATSGPGKGEKRALASGEVVGATRLTGEFDLEFRIKIPWGKGVWPGSLWLVNTDAPGGELDPMEGFYNAKSTPQVNLHSGPYNMPGKAATHKVDSRKPGIPATDWCAVLIQRRAKSVTVSWDDKQVATFDPSSPAWDPAYWENLEHRWQLKYNLQSGAGGGKVPATFTSAVMELDYVKVTGV